MYMSTQANLDYWSTDNCCVFVSLRKGTIVIGSLSVIWQSVVVAISVLALVECHLKETSLDDTAVSDTQANDTIVNVDTLFTSDTWENETAFYSSRANETCKWIPEAERESFGVYDQNMLYVVVGVILAFSSIYCLLSICVVVGVLWRSPRLLQGWVAFTALYMLLTLADLLITLPFTTLLHLLCCITQFVVSLYVWAVVKSYMHVLKVAKRKPPVPEEERTDYTVNGVDLQQDPVTV
ncbi:uncharacterized protein LOC119578655 [Penaeus monodon]|uniref:uncharacterized protein LOC119578655 n=1 Tax=Penaeus monodon TaxID=6687 RepID=UPI0018A6FAEC|nr:uncharacterized protein LOC119578655 [Penaeus monodon]XP_037782145.1 uncharacterized protein LOC119578655 [Penaeus monodon]